MSEEAVEPASYPLPSTVLARHGAWELLRSSPVPPAPRDQVLEEALVSLFVVAAQAIDGKWPMPEGIAGHVIVDSTEQACLDWGVAEDALGFHAVAARPADDPDSLDLPPDHRCYLNLPGLWCALADDEDDLASRLATLATLPHEMAHVALFARCSKGLTPVEVFDAMGGEEGLFAIESELESHSDDGHEDLAEETARAIVDQWIQAIPDALDKANAIAVALGPPSRRRPGLRRN